MSVFGVTERGVFKRCRRQWYITSTKHGNLEPIIPRQALQLGSIYHQSHADWITNQQESLADRFLFHANNEIERIKQNYQRHVGAEISDEEIEDSYSAMRMGHAMCKNYEQYWKTPLPRGFTLVAPEQVIIAPIPNTQHDCSDIRGHICSSCNTVHPCKGYHELEGTLDSLIADDKGYLYVLERKTYENRPNASSLNHSDQFLAYLWILQQLRIGEVAGIAYDGAWKRESPPKGKSLSDLFLRDILRRPQPELDEFEKHLTHESLEMATNPPETINRRWEGCYDCGVEKICTALSRDEDSIYIINQEYTQRHTPNYSTSTPDEFRQHFTPPLATPTAS